MPYHKPPVLPEVRENAIRILRQYLGAPSKESDKDAYETAAKKVARSPDYSSMEGSLAALLALRMYPEAAKHVSYVREQKMPPDRIGQFNPLSRSINIDTWKQMSDFPDAMLMMRHELGHAVGLPDYSTGPIRTINTHDLDKLSGLLDR